MKTKLKNNFEIIGRVNSLQYKIYATFLINAYNLLLVKEVYHIDLKYLENQVDDFNLQALNEIIDLKTKYYNDKESNFETYSLITYLKIENGICYYAFNKHIKHKLLNLDLCMQILLEMQNNFDNERTANIFEMLLQNVILNKTKAETLIIKIKDLRKTLNILEEYKKNTDFRRKVLEPIIEQINNTTDLNVKTEFVKAGNVYESIKFNIVMSLG